MRRNFKKAVTMLTFLSISIAQSQIQVLADVDTNQTTTQENPEGTTINNGTNGTVIDNNGKILSNDGYVENNNDTGDIETNNGTVENNGGGIDTNAGTVTYNNDEGVITANTGTVEYNDGGIVIDNTGTVNDNASEVTNNHGQIDLNEEEGSVKLNTNYIEQNDGIVGLVNDDDSDGPSDPGEEINVDIRSGNYGIIDNNNGTVTFNAGKDDKENLTELNISEDIKGSLEGGVIEVNEGLVIINNGTVGNYKGGTVEKNNGSVYNYGGVVKDNSTGTEYFRVTINSGSNVNKNESSLTSYDGDKWIGQQGEKQNTTEITISPSSGYYISGINVPNSLSSHVSVRSNSDGTWTISVKSGTNISLRIPNAQRSYVSSSGNDDDGEENKNDKGPQNPGNSGNILIDLQPVDANGQPVNVNLTDVVKSLGNTTEALNCFTSPLILNPNNIQGYGTVDLAALFSSQTTDNISVPVAANVVAGKTYTVYLNNGEPISITCTQNGQLLIPFGKGSMDVTFIICGEALTPFTVEENNE